MRHHRGLQEQLQYMEKEPCEIQGCLISSQAKEEMILFFSIFKNDFFSLPDKAKILTIVTMHIIIDYLMHF